MTMASDYWDALAPHHRHVENNYLDLSSIRLILKDLQQPILVVGAGQGLIVEELRNKGLRCDGVDLSAEMIKYAWSRRRLHLIQANAREMPFVAGAYETVIYATGVVDFLEDFSEIKAIMTEATRIVSESGQIFVAFYRFSAAQEGFLRALGLLRNDTLLLRSSLTIHRLSPAASISWVAARLQVSPLRAALLLMTTWLRSTRQEKRAALGMRKVFTRVDDPGSMIDAAPDTQPYRDTSAISDLFDRLSIRIGDHQACSGCYLVRL